MAPSEEKSGLDPNAALQQQLQEMDEFFKTRKELIQYYLGRDGAPIEKLQYKGNDIDIVELAMLIWVSRQFYFNGKPATQEQIREALARIIDVSPDHFSVRAGELKKRQETLKALGEWMRRLQAWCGIQRPDKPRQKRLDY